MAKAPTVPYTSVSDIEAFFERVQTIAEPKPPKRIDSSWVQSYQFETAHPGAIPSMLRWLGVTNEEDESTGVWNDLRIDTTREGTLQRLVKEAYKEIFDAVDVETAAARDLRGAFVREYAMGDPGRQIKCFLALCGQAGIKTAEAAPEPRLREAKAMRSGTEPKPKTEPKKPPGARDVSGRGADRQRGEPQALPISVTLNVEIAADWTEEEIRERIAAVKRAAHAVDS